MGKHFWLRNLDDGSRDKQPGCMWGLVHVLDYHHWQSNVRKMIQHRKYEGGRHDRCDWSPGMNVYGHDAFEAERLLDEERSLQASTKRCRATKKRSLKARIKALISEEMSREHENTREKGRFSLKPQLQRTYSIHHLESVDDGSGKIRTDWKHPIIFLPRNVEGDSSQSYDTTQVKTGGNLEADGGKQDMQSPKDGGKLDSKEDPDVFEIFKVDKELLLKHLQDSDERVFNFSRSAFGLNTKARFNKSRSFPVAELARRRKLKPITLESKQKEVWSFPREGRFQTDNQARRLDGSGYFGVLDHGETSGTFVQGTTNKEDKQRNNEVIMPSDDMVKDGKASLSVELNKLPNESQSSESFEEVSNREASDATDGIGEEHGQSGVRKHTHGRSSSLNESLDKYARLFENSFRKDAKLNSSKSLKLANEYGHAPLYFRRIRSLSHADSYYSNVSFEVVDDLLSGDDLIVIAKRSSSGLQNIEEEKVGSLVKSNEENVPLNSNMQINEDNESLRLHTRDGDGGKVDDLKEEADKLKKSDSLWEMDTNCSDIAQNELQDLISVLDSDICMQEAESHAVELQGPKGFEHGFRVQELNSSIDNDLKSLQSKPISTCSTLNLENDETSDKITNFERDEGQSPNKKNSDLDYVRHLLDRSGIAVDATEITWHASDRPFSPQLYEEVEAGWPHEEDQLTGWPDFDGCWHHQMLFDLVNEDLLDVYDTSLPYYPKALSSRCHVRPFPVGNHIIEEVCTSIGTLLNTKPEEKQSLDCIVARDLARDHGWMNLQLETEFIALGLEDIIFNELLQEVISS